MSRLFILLLCFIINLDNIYAVELKKPQNKEIYNFSGDNQSQHLTKKTENPIRVLVLDDNGQAIKGHKLLFSVIKTPKNASGYKFLKSEIETDSLGIAENYFIVGDKEGQYEIMVSSKFDSNSKPLFYTVKAQKSSWIFFLIMGLFGGVAIFLYGMEILSKGLQTSTGAKLRNVLQKFTKNRFLALIAGIIATVVFQSSSATSVMLVGFVEAGIMKFEQTLGMLLGAGIGTTITTQLIALKLTDFSLLIVTIGFILMFLSKNLTTQNIGKSILGFGFIFFGMYIMSEAMHPLRDYPAFINLMIKLENPILGIFVGFVFTALIQSSAAFIGILITIGSKGLISLEAAISLVLGANLGTGITAIIASINTGKEAQRVAFAHTLFKFLGILVFVWFIPEYAKFLKIISNVNDPQNSEQILKSMPFMIANSHMFFSFSVAILILPFITPIGKIIKKIIPDKKIQNEKHVLRYINPTYKTSPALALSLAKKEAERMGETIKEMVSLSLVPFLEKNDKVLIKWQELENEADFLKEKINEYLISVSTENSDKQRLNEAFQIMYVIKELEMIADIVNTNLRKQAVKWLSQNVDFSDEGKQELITLQEKVLKQISRAMEVFNDVNLEKAINVKNKFKKYSQLAEDFERHHYTRLIENNPLTASSSEVHLELIGLFNAINRHATNIARILIIWNE